MSGPSVPQPYQPTGQATADQGYQSLLQSQQPYAQNLPGQVIPGVQTQVNNLVNNPYTAQAQTSANASGAALGQLAPQQTAAANSMFGAGNQALGAGNSVLATGFDPQNALYAQQYQQMQDQQNAMNAQNGVAGSPYAAGLSGQAGQNFNMNWLNNQLGRETTALGAYGNANSTASSDFGAGSTLGSLGAASIFNSGNLPYTTANTIGQNNITAYNDLSSATSGALAPGDSLMSALDQYLGLGQSATQIADQAQEQQYQQSNALMSGLGSLIFGPMTNPFQTASSGSSSSGASSLLGGLLGSSGSSSGSSASSLASLAPALLAFL